jgi:ribose 5-phosphate isomerase A
MGPSAVARATRFDLGTGTTVAMFVVLMVEKDATRAVEAVIPTSRQSEDLARRAGLRIASLGDFPESDVYVDSFDQVDRAGNAVKGGGGAHVKEKVLMAASRKVVLIGDYLKLRDYLSGPVPVEVLPFAVDFLLRAFMKMGMRPSLRPAGQGKVGPAVTKNGNLLIDLNPELDAQGPQLRQARDREGAGRPDARQQEDHVLVLVRRFR